MGGTVVHSFTTFRNTYSFSTTDIFITNSASIPRILCEEHYAKRACTRDASNIPVQLENNKFLERKGMARRISERLRARARAVIYESPLKRKALYRCRLGAIGLSLNLGVSSAHPRARRSDSNFLYFGCIVYCISLSTMHHSRPAHFRFDDERAPTLVSARSSFVTVTCG